MYLGYILGLSEHCVFESTCNATISLKSKKMFSLLPFDLVGNYATPYDTARTTYLDDAAKLKEATGPYKAARDAYVAATATYTKSLYE
jgi:hypothetical protein